MPYIPLYLGDWIQDTDCLTIAAEGAWLRVVFKCWKNNGMFSGTPDVFARICKVSTLDFASILLEWKTNNICDVSEDQSGIITVLCRRIRRDLEISQVRSENGSKGGSKTQAKKKAKGKAKEEQNTDIDNEVDDDNVDVFGIKKEWSILVRKVYANEKHKRIYDLKLYFEKAGKIKEFQSAGFIFFEDFMKANPANEFKDDGHLYNTFRKFHLDKQLKQLAGKKEVSLESLKNGNV